MIDHETAHPGATVPDVSSPDELFELFETPSGRGALGERDAGSDVEPEPISALPDELEVDTSVSVKETREIGSLERGHVNCWPSLGIA